MNNVWILAQTSGGGISSTSAPEDGQSITQTPGGSQSQPVGQNPGQSPTNPLTYVFLMVFMVIMVVIMFRTPQKQKQERKKLEQSLEKNDKVVTIGGIIGTVIDIKEQEILLKIDESNNTKVKVLRSAIGRNLSKEKV
jgi:preprotein translocase subunit YajC